MLIPYIMSGLALLAAAVCMVMLVMEKKRNQKRNTVLMDYATAEATAFAREAKHAVLFELREEMQTELKEIRKALAELEKRISDLEKGIVPDYEEQRTAADAVNDFARSISSLLNYDPMEALQKERERQKHGGEVR